MSYLEKLLNGADVEWKTLGEVAIKISSGGTPKTEVSTYYGGAIPWLRTQEVGFGDIWDTGVKITEAGLANSSANMIPENCVIVAMYGATVGRVGINKIPLSTNQACANIQLDEKAVHYRFAYHFLLSQYEYIKSLGAGSQTNINAQIIKGLPIPVPPLSVQRVIVRILDRLTELIAKLTTELTTELTARKKQYAFYREALLSFDVDKVEHIPMGDETIGKFIRGGGLQKKDLTESGVGCIHYGQIYTYYGTYTYQTKSFVSVEFARKARMAASGDIIIATTSETDEDLCKAVAWLGLDDIAVSSDACFYVHILNPKYVAYFFQTEQFQKLKKPFITGTKVRRVNADDLAKIKIPVPSIEVQERIVSILDKFDTLTTSISEGLPKELELRKRQHKYYRDMLLTFNADKLES